MNEIPCMLVHSWELFYTNEGFVSKKYFKIYLKQKNKKTKISILYNVKDLQYTKINLNNQYSLSITTITGKGDTVFYFDKIKTLADFAEDISKILINTPTYIDIYAQTFYNNTTNSMDNDFATLH